MERKHGKIQKERLIHAVMTLYASGLICKAAAERIVKKIEKGQKDAH